MQRLFSGIQPSGNLHIGNYLGAIRQWTDLAADYEALFCIVDLHALTVPQDPVALRAKTLEFAKIYLASGLDPSKVTIFVQSQVPEHTELMWILNTITKNGDLTKMTQFKDKTRVDFEDFHQIIIRQIETLATSENLFQKTQKEVFDITKESAALFTTQYLQQFKEIFNQSLVGLFDYPVLMAADILLYDTAVVPVGRDQLQHIELTRTLARRFNERFGETFTVPEGKVSKEGQLIMGLDDPTKKMSKSASSEYNFIALSDTPDIVRKKIMKAVTDSGSEIAYSDDKPAFKNLIHIYSLLSEKTSETIVAEYAGRGYGDFKRDLAEVIVNFLAPFQVRLAEISDEEVQAVLSKGASKAGELARTKMMQIRERVGLVE